MTAIFRLSDRVRQVATGNTGTVLATIAGEPDIVVRWDHTTVPSSTPIEGLVRACDRGAR